MSNTMSKHQKWRTCCSLRLHFTLFQVDVRIYYMQPLSDKYHALLADWRSVSQFNGIVVTYNFLVCMIESLCYKPLMTHCKQFIDTHLNDSSVIRTSIWAKELSAGQVESLMWRNETERIWEPCVRPKSEDRRCKQRYIWGCNNCMKQWFCGDRNV